VTARTRWRDGAASFVTAYQGNFGLICRVTADKSSAEAGNDSDGEDDNATDDSVSDVNKDEPPIHHRVRRQPGTRVLAAAARLLSHSGQSRSGGSLKGFGLGNPDSVDCVATRRGQAARGTCSFFTGTSVFSCQLFYDFRLDRVYICGTILRRWLT
jgi:hypothetical protein